MPLSTANNCLAFAVPLTLASCPKVFLQVLTRFCNGVLQLGQQWPRLLQLWLTTAEPCFHPPQLGSLQWWWQKMALMSAL